MPKRGRGRGRSGGGKKVRGGRSVRPAPKPVPPREAPPTEGLLGSAAPPVERPTVIPLAPPPVETEGLLRPGEPEPQDARPPGAAEDTLTPEVWRAVGYGLPTGLSVPTLSPGAPGAAPWPDRMRTLLRTPMAERPAYERTQREQKPEAAVRNIPRILDLTLRIAELLLATGEAAEDVEAAMLGIAHAYGLDHCEPQVTFTLIGISHQPSLVEPPVTADRVVRRRTTDYNRLAAVYKLVGDITAEKISVNDAYRRLAEIRRNRHPYPTWLLSLATGLLAGAASFLVGGRLDARAWLVFANAFVAAILGDRLAALIARRGLPEFYQFVIAAMPAATSGVILSLYHSSLRGSVVITGGLFALLPGRALVAAVQDGLTGFYITAAARLLEVLYLVAGIIIGVMLVIYLGLNFGARLNPSESLAGFSHPPVQLLAAIVLTVAFAVLLQTGRRNLPLVALNSCVGWSTYGVLTQNASVSPIVATGVAAGLVGLFGQLMARYRNASSLPYVTAAIGPLMPGSAIYLGMLSFTQNEPVSGLVAVGRAAALALALAVGVNLGGEIARLFLKRPGVEQPLAPALRVPRRAAKRTRGF
ncbi:threonine/serine ThrE exporter family protein [Saccharothrix sp. ST-888]|uniref:threonine/serine ThrE exporter family protein n=1 Tax=Saccharothrix sp. ST-888 TaxID=1427391 RepID=UPI000AC05F14|nr:threonine/serine exporter family protein [Saccharothrix sp. ST-888]